MELCKTFTDFVGDREEVERTLFEKAMVDRIEKGEGYRLCDLIYDVFVCQKQISILQKELDHMQSKPKSKGK
jgi:hypothetical protein